jgi:HEXXH motif-containing protein
MLAPLAAVAPARGRSATSQEAFGAAAMTEPSTPADLATSLVHEWQHSKLCALIAGTPLSIGDGDDRYFAPWRPDSRPLSGLLHGSFAFLAVCELWAALRAEPGLDVIAEQQFATRREQLVPALRALAASRRLTDAGQVLVTAMRTHHERLLAEPVSAGATRSARKALRDNYEVWLRHNDGGSTESSKP